MSANSLVGRGTAGRETVLLLLSIEHMARDAKQIAEIRYIVEGVIAGVPGLGRVPVEELRRRTVNMGSFNLDVMHSIVEMHQKMLAIPQAGTAPTALVMASGVILHELQSQLDELDALVGYGAKGSNSAVSALAVVSKFSNLSTLAE